MASCLSLHCFKLKQQSVLAQYLLLEKISGNQRFISEPVQLPGKEYQFAELPFYKFLGLESQGWLEQRKLFEVKMLEGLESWLKKSLIILWLNYNNLIINCSTMTLINSQNVSPSSEEQGPKQPELLHLYCNSYIILIGALRRASLMSALSWIGLVPKRLFCFKIHPVKDWSV